MLLSRVRRPFVAAVSAAVALSLSGAPYAAADTLVVIHGAGDLPTDGSAGLFFVNCSAPWTPSGTLNPGPIHIQQGPTPVPAGTRTWGFDMPAGSAGWAVGPFRSVTSMATLSTAQAAFYNEGAGTASGIALADVVEDDATGVSWIGTAPLMLATGSWATESVAGLGYSWTQINPQLQPLGPTFSGTITQLLTHIGSGDHDGLIGAGFGCNTPGLVDFDKAQIGDPGDVTTYDFEAELTKTTISGKPSTITAGQSVTLRGVMTDSTGSPFSSAQLTLQAKAFGSTTWKNVGQAMETNDGTQHPATLTVKPRVKTSYRWTFPETAAALGSTSPAFTVKVHTAVTAKAADTTVTKGTKIVVTGRTTPRKPGFPVRLIRGSTKIGTAIVKADGSYRIVVKATSIGTWKLHVTIAAETGNLAGTSRTVKVVVS